jgi:hypothetical protein
VYRPPHIERIMNTKRRGSDIESDPRIIFVENPPNTRKTTEESTLKQRHRFRSVVWGFTLYISPQRRVDSRRPPTLVYATQFFITDRGDASQASDERRLKSKRLSVIRGSRIKQQETPTMQRLTNDSSRFCYYCGKAVERRRGNVSVSEASHYQGHQFPPSRW